MTAQRIERLRRKLVEHKLDALFVISPETASPTNRRYLSGFTGTSAYLLITADDVVLATDSRYWEQAERQAPECRILRAIGGFDKWLPELLAGQGGKRIAFEGAHITYQTHRAIRKEIQKLPESERPKLVATVNLV
ncbi:MAG: aminopeptidase P family N-terminal domain-containing protein, partial [Chloroflexi bacterium]|nr:aminopeptidase P family N-terminal domain-containing protein [Chloroflexota bacterium]